MDRTMRTNKLNRIHHGDTESTEFRVRRELNEVFSPRINTDKFARNRIS